MYKKEHKIISSFLIVFGFFYFSLMRDAKLYAQKSNNQSLNYNARPRSEILFDDNWSFHRGGAQGAERVNFDDTNWRQIDLPHDWSIEDLPGTESPFDSNAVGQASTGFTVVGVGWYRKSFTVPDSLKHKKIYIQFDGVYMNAEVWINGHELGKHPYGYTSFWYDISDKIKFDQKNILAVKVRNVGENSRWYSGSGIYRHVWLKIMNPIHVAQWGVNIKTPKVDSTAASVALKTQVKNETKNSIDITLVTTLIDPQGNEIKKVTSDSQIVKNSEYQFNQNTVVQSPQLWSTDSPVLYSAISKVYKNGTLSDQKNTKFGIRSIAFSAQKGFLLNGNPLLLKGEPFITETVRLVPRLTIGRKNAELSS